MRHNLGFTKALLWSACAFALGAAPALARAETLDQAVERAWQTHPSLQQARTGVDIAQAERRSELSRYFPTLSLSGTGGRTYADNSTSRGLSVTRGAGYSYLWEGTATLRQMLFDGFETGSRVDSSEAQKKAAELNTLDVKENLALQTAQAYSELLRTQKALEMLSKHKVKVEDYVGRIKSMVDEGGADESDHQQARDIKVILDGIISDYESQHASALANFQELTGQTPEGKLIDPVLPAGFVFKDAQQACDYAQEHHPLLLAAGMNAKSVAYRKDAETASLYPDFDGELSYYKVDKRDLIGGEAVDARAVVRMNWNFETGGGQIARIRKARQEHQQALSRAQELRQQIVRDITLAYTQRDLALKQSDNQSQRLSLNENLMKTYQAQFEGARLTLLQLMQGDNQLFSTRLDRLNAQYRLMQAEYTILAKSGRLQEAIEGMIERSAGAGILSSIKPAAGPAPIPQTPSVEVTPLPPAPVEPVQKHD